MAAFLENITPFIGNGTVNENGEDLETFLDHYNADKYKKPSVTADILVFSYCGTLTKKLDGLKLLMIKRRNHPCIGMWALPGGFANMQEDLIESARRELEEETSLTDVPMEQLFTYGEYKRDPRDRVVTTAYIALIEEGTKKAQAGDDAAEAVWWDVSFQLRKERQFQEKEREVKEEIYQIILTDQNTMECISAVVAKYENTSGVLKNTRFQMIETNGIAFDHPRFIVQGLLYLLERI
ncbi:NUDIX domain-containing protein [Anaeromicropila populeti]|uniref:8-oxo-dGTP diphosphatase n=1 Tax=Anaeromicropila populeti TaxID=37658 RepID=A0A1I6LBY3_9FIRM|nr:NUDIX hydrolase [Anaeromicropila populeti]SFS01012.1 8-oxo-dGTP diphosphatase [Anaeromicropila populeti]